MRDITLEDLHAYLDESLGDADLARIEQALRNSASLRTILRSLMHEGDRGEHSVGAIWRRNRCSCPSREQLGSYLLGVLDDGLQGYIRFHLTTVGCSYCQANLADLQSRPHEPEVQVQRRKRFFESSAGLLDRK